MPISPTPLMPSGLLSSRSSTKITLISCTSAFTGMVLGDIGIHDAAEGVIYLRFLVQRHADAPDYAAESAARGLRVQDAPGRPR